MAMKLNKDDSEMVRNMMWQSIVALIGQAENDLGRDNNNRFAKKQTFLTQLDEKDAGIQRIRRPTLQDKVKQVVRFEEDSNKTLETPIAMDGEGSKMDAKLQRSLLARYQQESNLVTKNLLSKRLDFEKRINACREKQDQLSIKQKENDQMQKHYSQFIHEKDAIRRRAIAKYQTELKVRLQKMIEYDLLVKQLEEVTAIHKKISVKVEKSKKFKDFLSKVIELLPDNYLEAGDSKYNSLILRHETLFESNVDLFDILMQNSDEIKILRNEYEKMILDHNSNKMSINSELGRLIHEREELQAKNARFEENLIQESDKKREQMVDLSRVMWAIDNLATKSIEKTKYESKSVDSMSIEEKLNAIKTYIHKKNEVIKTLTK